MIRNFDLRFRRFLWKIAGSRSRVPQGLADCAAHAYIVFEAPASRQNNNQEQDIIMLHRAVVLALFSALALSVSAPAYAGDAAAGEKVFKKCKACHTLEEGKNRVGPSLAGVVGRAAGTVEGYKYSKAMKESGLTWDEATLDTFLTKPKDLVKKTKMAFAGLKKEEDRANVIAYLKAQ